MKYRRSRAALRRAYKPACLPPYSRRSSVWFRRWLRLRPRGLAARSLAHAEYVRSAILRSASHSLLLWQASRQSGCFVRYFTYAPRKRPELPVASTSTANVFTRRLPAIGSGDGPPGKSGAACFDAETGGG